jgi:hypothetical protein
MTLPTFVGIGVPRAGTTWLHALLEGHPDVFVPTARKEIRFFDRHYDRGLSWYEGFFPPAGSAGAYRSIGEISPQYFYCDECASRIASTLPDVRLLLMLRHPVDRAYSNYGFVVQRRNYRGTFEEFLATRPRAVDMGFYGPHLRTYLSLFHPSRILPLVFERALGDAGEEGDSRGALGAFLGVSAEGFPASVGRVNATTVPRHPMLASVAVRTARRLRQRHLESIADLGERVGIRRLWAGGVRMSRLDPDVRAQLSRRYEGEFDEIERALGVDLSCWRT